MSGTPVTDDLPPDALRAALDEIDEKAGWADHGSIEDGPAFARGARWAAETVRAALTDAPAASPIPPLPPANPSLMGDAT